MYKTRQVDEERRAEIAENPEKFRIKAYACNRVRNKVHHTRPHRPTNCRSFAGETGKRHSFTTNTIFDGGGIGWRRGGAGPRPAQPITAFTNWPTTNKPKFWKFP